MNKVYVDDRTLSRFSRITSPCNFESTIYKNKDTLYKILLPMYRNKYRETAIELLSELNHPNCVFPKDKVYDKNTERFIGLTEEYLNQYMTLSYLLKNNTLDFNTRKDIAFKICEIQDDLNKLNISFIDMHPHNVMLNNENTIKLVDLDGSDIFTKKHSDVFEQKRKATISRNLNKICFLLLYGNDFNINSLEINDCRELLNASTQRQKEFLESIFFKRQIDDTREYLNDFNEKDMEVCKLILHR